jgi:hypothetical protein
MQGFIIAKSFLLRLKCNFLKKYKGKKNLNKDCFVNKIKY